MTLHTVLATLTVLAMAPSPTTATAATSDPAPLPGTQAVSVGMVEAIRARSYQDFLANGDVQLRAQVGRPQFDDLCSRYAEPLGKGYRLMYVDHLRRRGTLVVLWKLTLADSDDEALLTIVMRDSRVEDFSIL